jgi:hypothetical protein
MKKLVLLLAFVSSTISASQFNMGENLITPYQPEEDNWEVLKKNEPQERAMMWADKKLGFSDSYTVTVYPKRKKALSDVREIQDAPGRKACKLFESIDLPALENKNYESAFWRTKCETASGFKAQMINLLIQGEDSLYSIQRVWRGPKAIPKIDTWVARISQIYVCDTREEDKACPSGFDKVKEM